MRTAVSIPGSLTPAQSKVLGYYRGYFKKNKYMPSFREAAKSLKIDAGNVHYHIKKLESKGLVVRTGGYRGISLVEEDRQVVPLLGEIACGKPIAVFEESEEQIHVPRNMITRGYGHYALRARGDSMINSHITDGDLLLIRQQSDFSDGDIAVVITGDSSFEEATLKRVFRTKRALLLKPENDALEPYLVKDGQVRGKLVGVIRQYED